MIWLRYGLVLALVLAINVLLWAIPNRPQPLTPPPGGKIRSVSFAPFREGQSPLLKIYPTAAQIDADLQAISSHVAGIRTYSSLEGMEATPELAAKYGLNVTMGAWLGKKPDVNDLEIASLIRLATDHPETIRRVIVGNEVLLRKDLRPDQLIAHIRKVKSSVSQPVTYADVWEFWLKYPEIAAEVDFITIHILPYWEDIPAGIDEVRERVLEAVHAIQTRFPGKPILIGEAGWPTAGRVRGPAEPGLAATGRFINTFLHLAETRGFDYNLIEAFDQTWKARLEGTVGSHWGLFTTERQAKFPLNGPVVENPHWRLHAGLSGGLAVLLTLMAVTGRSRPVGFWRFLALALGVQIMSSALLRAAAMAMDWNHFLYDQALAVLLLWLESVCAVVLSRRLGQWACGELHVAPGYQRVTASAFSPFHRHFFCALESAPVPGNRQLPDAGATALLLLSGLAVIWSMLLVVDGRYRDFPIPDYLAPILGLLTLATVRALTGPTSSSPLAGLSFGLAIRGHRLIGAAGAPRTWRRAMTLAPWETALAALLLLGAGACLVAEGITNREAVQWAALQGLLALPYAATVALARLGYEPA